MARGIEAEKSFGMIRIVMCQKSGIGNQRSENTQGWYQVYDNEFSQKP
jgi:hypothetical protein